MILQFCQGHEWKTCKLIWDILSQILKTSNKILLPCYELFFLNHTFERQASRERGEGAEEEERKKRGREGEGARLREVSHLLVHSPDACKSQHWVKSSLGSGNLEQVSHVSSSNQLLGSSPAVSKGRNQVGNLDSNPGILDTVVS